MAVLITSGSLWRNKRLRDLTVRVVEATTDCVRLEGVSAGCLPLMSIESFLSMYEPVP